MPPDPPPPAGFSPLTYKSYAGPVYTSFVERNGEIIFELKQILAVQLKSRC